MSKIKIAVIGATGYTGSELLRLLMHHPDVSLEMITSESRSGEDITAVHPQLEKLFSLKLNKIAELENIEPDLVYLALPHRVSMNFVKDHFDKNYRIIDLSGDFRLDNAEVYEKWYDKKHVYEKGISESVYGLPELYREKIKDAKLVANPGCYPTSVIMPLAPLVQSELIDPAHIIADAKSGITGAGAKAKEVTHFPSVNENFSAYGLKTHRHTPEIEMALKGAGNKEVNVQFTPHLLPVNRGILATSYSLPVKEVNEDQLQKLYKEFYADEPFVRIRNSPPSIQQVRGSNFCDIYITFDERTGNIITVSAIDNLVKGAAGQAVQNMNIMYGLDEKTGLLQGPLTP